MPITLADVERARSVTAPHLHRTPMLTSRTYEPITQNGQPVNVEYDFYVQLKLPVRGGVQ